MAKPITYHTPGSLQARCIEEGDCWLWQGYNCNGAPMVSHGGRLMAVRRVFTQLLGGHAPCGGYFGVTCGTPGCVNPEHTTWRSQRAQSAFMARTANASASAQHIKRKKISQARRTLGADVLHDILHSPDTAHAVAARHHISPSTVSKYRRGEIGHHTASNVWAGLGARV